MRKFLLMVGLNGLTRRYEGREFSEMDVYDVEDAIDREVRDRITSILLSDNHSGYKTVILMTPEVYCDCAGDSSTGIRKIG